MKNRFAYLLALAIGLTFAGCKKDSPGTPVPTATKADLLTAKKWRVSASTTTTTYNNQTTTSDSYASSPACERDDFTQFNANKTATFDEGATRCSSTDPQTTSGTWDLNSDQTKLNLTSPDFGGLVVPFDIVALDASTLSLRFTQSASGAASTMNITFKSF